MSENTRFVRLSRGFFEHFLWQESRKYSRAEAWLDLVQHAAYAPYVRLVKGQTISLERGSLVASVRWLCDRWLWSNTKVCQFLDLLRTQEMITTTQREHTTVISLCNFDLYNPAPLPKNDPKKKSERRPSDRTEDGLNETNEPPRPEGRAESLDAVTRYCVSLGLPASDGLYLWESWQAGGWTRGGNPIEDWRACARSWQAGGYLPSQKKSPCRRKSLAQTLDPTGTLASQY